MKKLIISLLIIVALFLLVFWLGPKPVYKPLNPTITHFQVPIENIEDFIKQKDGLISDLRKGNESVIKWADSLRKTPYSIVFLHGFSASPMEGNPLAYELANHLNANLYIPLLEGHGRVLSDSNFLNLTPQALLESAKQTIAIGNVIGEKVIVVSSSTGGTLSAYLAAHNPDMINAQVMCSPNIKIANSSSNMVLYPWGLQLARLAFGSKFRSYELEEKEAMNYWTTRYRLEGVQCLVWLVNNTMIETVFNKINQPTFVAYYNGDDVVSIPAMHQFIEQISTPKNLKSIKDYPEVGAHVMTSKFQAKDRSRLTSDIINFCDNIQQENFP